MGALAWVLGGSWWVSGGFSVGFGGFSWVITFEFSLLFQLDGGVRRLKHGFVAVNRRGLGLVPRLAREGRVLLKSSYNDIMRYDPGAGLLTVTRKFNGHRSKTDRHR